jgi:hypothetical protein
MSGLPKKLARRYSLILGNGIEADWRAAVSNRTEVPAGEIGIELREAVFTRRMAQEQSNL